MRYIGTHEGEGETYKRGRVSPSATGAAAASSSNSRLYRFVESCKSNVNGAPCRGIKRLETTTHNDKDRASKGCHPALALFPPSLCSLSLSVSTTSTRSVVVPATVKLFMTARSRARHIPLVLYFFFLLRTPRGDRPERKSENACK